MSLNSGLIFAFPWPTSTNFPRRPPGFATVGRCWRGLDPDGLAGLIGDIFADAQPEESTLRLSVTPYVHNPRNPNWIPRVDVQVTELTDCEYPVRSLANTLLADYLREVIRGERRRDGTYESRMMTFTREGWFWHGNGTMPRRGGAMRGRSFVMVALAVAMPPLGAGESWAQGEPLFADLPFVDQRLEPRSRPIAPELERRLLDQGLRLDDHGHVVVTPAVEDAATGRFRHVPNEPPSYERMTGTSVPAALVADWLGPRLPAIRVGDPDGRARDTD